MMALLACDNRVGTRFVKAQNGVVTWSPRVLESVAKYKLDCGVQRVYDVAPTRSGSCNVKSVANGNLRKMPAEMAFSGDRCSRSTSQRDLDVRRASNTNAGQATIALPHFN